MDGVKKVHAEHLDSFIAKSIGLIGATRPRTVHFTTRWGIHTFGVRFPIDVLILDDRFTVVRVRKRLPPNRILLWNPRYRQVIELPAGGTDRLQINRGDTVYPI